MELKTKYQYTNFIYPYMIDETKYDKYILKLLKDKNCKFKLFEKEKDLDIYNFFLPYIRNYLFPTFEFRNEKLKDFKELSIETKSKIISKHNMTCFEYYLDEDVQGKMGEENGIFFDVEKIEIICFKTGICFLSLKTHIDGTESFSDILDFNYRFKTLCSEFSNLKDYENIKNKAKTEMIRKVGNQLLKTIKESKKENYIKKSQEWKEQREYWFKKKQEYEENQGKYEARQELYEKQLQEINIRNLAKDVYRILAEENISKNQTLKRITKTFGDLSKREIKEIMRKNKDAGFDWYHEM